MLAGRVDRIIVTFGVSRNGSCFKQLLLVWSGIVSKITCGFIVLIF